MDFKKILIILVIIIGTVNLFAQENVRIRKKEFITTDAGAKEAWKSVKKGNSEFSEGNFNFNNAKPYYLKAYEFNKKNAALNYKLGMCFLYGDEKNKATKYLKESFDLNNQITKDILFQLARAYHMSYDFSNAKKYYKLYQATVSPRKLKRLKINIDRYIAECEQGQDLMNKPERTVVQNVGKAINSEADDYYAVIDPKDENIYFTSRRSSKRNNKINELDHKYGEDIYISKKKANEWGNAQLLSQRLFTNKSEAPVAIDPSTNDLYIYKSNKGGSIYKTFLKEGKWTNPKLFSKINSSGRETSLSFSEDGYTCYFVSDRDHINAVGGKDIYVSRKNEKGRWSKPENLGNTINTSFDEEGVCISGDGKTLYFSSKGHSGMGGYDVFKSEFSNGQWSAPKNLGYPLNTPDNDLYFRLSKNKKIAYISGNREDAIGGYDIYKVIFLGAEKQLQPVSNNSDLAFEIIDKRSLLIAKSDLLTIDSSIILTGKVIDADTKAGIIAKMQFVDSEKSMVAASFITDSTGVYRVKLPTKKNYGLEITARGYLMFLDAVNLSKEPNDIIQKDFELKELSVGAKVVLKNIFFETGKATLKMESYQQLDNVVSFMKENPTLTLEISGHTDNVGLPAANIKLSQARAKSVVDYVLSMGIEKNRLTFKGYGPKQPIAPNKTKEGKALNRRVEFKITGK